MVRTLFFAAFLACAGRHYGQRIMRAALLAAGFAGLFLWNCHNISFMYFDMSF
jgi:hypothetical protein